MANVTLHSNPNEGCPHFQASYLQKCMWASIGIEDALNQMDSYDHLFSTLRVSRPFTIHYVCVSAFEECFLNFAFA
jgi:hypothetical protein